MQPLNPICFMKKIISILLCLYLHAAFANTTAEAYLDRFMKFSSWYQQLPLVPGPDFFTFIDQKTPLAQKLRDKWLYEAARTKSWALYTQHYQDSADPNLQCYEQLALYYQGQQQKAIEGAKTLWLNGTSQPKPCDELFNLLLKTHDINEKLITQRLVLALDNRNVGLASFLLQQYHPPRLQEIKVLDSIYRNPKRITELSPSELHGEFYLYGLKRLVSMDMDKALKFWQLPKTKQLLNKKQQQSFIAHIALYKALRNHDDASAWFAKMEPTFKNETLLSWQVRLALKNRQWKKVENLIYQLHDKNEPCWQYWLARALYAQGKKEEAMVIYQALAKTRNYYGFLASLRLKQQFSFKNEQAIENTQRLKPYHSITDQIKNLYLTKQIAQASRLLNDFASELPKDDKSALAYWLSHDLQWHGKALYLSNTDELNNQLSLRFPLAYPHTVKTYARNYKIPQEFVYAIIRQESGFREDVISSAGAQGLMQVMPATASAISKKEKIDYKDKKQLFSSQKNINIGVAYLKQLAQRFHEHPILMAAAYNAGPRQVVYWMQNHPPKEMDIWIETLPWHETRNYLKNVVSFYVVYQYRLQTKPDMSVFMKRF